MFQIKIGSRVCVRTQMPNRPGFVFVEGAIIDMQNETKTYTVQLMNSNSSSKEKMYNVKRAHIRLLRPPWWDELNDANNESMAVEQQQHQQPPQHVHSAAATAAAYAIAATNQHHHSHLHHQHKKSYPSSSSSGSGGSRNASTSSTIIYNNASASSGGNGSRLKYPTTRADGSGGSLQLHQVIPTIQVSDRPSRLSSKNHQISGNACWILCRWIFVFTVNNIYQSKTDISYETYFLRNISTFLLRQVYEATQNPTSILSILIMFAIYHS